MISYYSGECWPLQHSKWIKVVGEILEMIGKVVTSLKPRPKFGLPIANFVQGFFHFELCREEETERFSNGKV